jgi:hypothetical protein
MQTFVAERICIWQGAELSPCAIDLYSSPENSKYHKLPAYKESELILAHGRTTRKHKYNINIYSPRSLIVYSILKLL